MRYYIGLDVGTTGAKTVLINERGEIKGSASNEYPSFNVKPLWSEQNPEDWWSASRKSFREVTGKAGIDPSEIKGIGLTGQMHGLVMLDKNGKPVRPCIMWNDQRTEKECRQITDLIGFQNLLKITGNPVLPGFTAPKILWVKNNEPEVYEKTAFILLPKDYIRYRLTGELVTDVSDASGTSLLDVSKRKWSEEMIRLLEIDKHWLPEVKESVEISGRVKHDASVETFIPEGTPVVAGAGDQAAGGIGAGAVEPGIASVVIGTSGVVFTPTDRLTIEPDGKLHAFCHAVPGKWHLMGVTLAAAGSYKWLRDALCRNEKVTADEMAIDAYEIMNTEASLITPGSDGLIFLPYISGERTPYPDPHARGSFIGITGIHKKQHFVRAVMEGVAYSLRDCLEINRTLGMKTGQARISGGGAKSLLWRQIIADVFNAEVISLASSEGAPYGAAILAAVAGGAFSGIEEAVNACLEIKESIQPIRQNCDIYEDYYRIYRNIYPNLKNTFSGISAVVNKYYNY